MADTGRMGPQRLTVEFGWEYHPRHHLKGVLYWSTIVPGEEDYMWRCDVGVIEMRMY